MFVDVEIGCRVDEIVVAIARTAHAIFDAHQAQAEKLAILQIVEFDCASFVEHL